MYNVIRKCCVCLCKKDYIRICILINARLYSILLYIIWFVFSSSQIPSLPSVKKETKPSRLSLSQRKATSTDFKVPAAKNKKNISNIQIKTNPDKSNRQDLAKLKFLHGSNWEDKIFETSTASSSQKRELSSTDDQGGRIKKEKLDVCPLCMMPWGQYNIMGKSREYHTDECLDMDWSDKTGKLLCTLMIIDSYRYCMNGIFH